ncbi:hypothetical protein FRC09_015963, partial [Ceratobasidium sp. 395]
AATPDTPVSLRRYLPWGPQTPHYELPSGMSETYQFFPPCCHRISKLQFSGSAVNEERRNARRIGHIIYFRPEIPYEHKIYLTEGQENRYQTELAMLEELCHFRPHHLVQDEDRYVPVSSYSDFPPYWELIERLRTLHQELDDERRAWMPSVLAWPHESSSFDNKQFIVAATVFTDDVTRYLACHCLAKFNWGIISVTTRSPPRDTVAPQPSTSRQHTTSAIQSRTPSVTDMHGNVHPLVPSPPRPTSVSSTRSITQRSVQETSRPESTSADRPISQRSSAASSELPTVSRIPSQLASPAVSLTRGSIGRLTGVGLQLMSPEAQQERFRVIRLPSQAPSTSGLPTYSQVPSRSISQSPEHSEHVPEVGEATVIAPTSIALPATPPRDDVSIHSVPPTAPSTSRTTNIHGLTGIGTLMERFSQLQATRHSPAPVVQSAPVSQRTSDHSSSQESQTSDLIELQSPISLVTHSPELPVQATEMVPIVPPDNGHRDHIIPIEHVPETGEIGHILSLDPNTHQVVPWEPETRSPMMYDELMLSKKLNMAMCQMLQ